MKKNYTGEIALLGAAFLWGSGFIAVEDALNNGFSPFLLLACRGLIGAIFLAIVSLKYGKWTKLTLKHGFIAGCFMFIAFALQTYGQMLSTVSNAAFLTTLYVVMTPFILRVFFKRQIKKMVYVGAIIGLIGTAFLSLEGSLILKEADILLILCALFFGLHIIYLESLQGQHSALSLTSVQLMTMSVLSWVFIIPTQTQAITGGIPAVFYCGIVSSGIAFFLQTYGQKYVSSSMASLLLTLESVFAVMFSMLIFNEVLSIQMWIGGALLLIAVLIVNYSEGKQEKNPQ